MRSPEAVPGLVVLALRLALVPPARWALDWIAVLAVFWIALALTRDQTPGRRWSVALACAWLAVIYAVHQGPWILAAWN